MKTLASYRADTDLTQAAFARRLDISRSYLNEIEAGKKTPGLGLALKIESETRGLVSTRSWFSDSAPVAGADSAEGLLPDSKRANAARDIQGAGE